MPRLYLREAEPFLPLDQRLKLEETIQTSQSKKPTNAEDVSTQRRLARRSTSLLVSDTIVVVIEILQLLALIQSMSLKWAWPEKWIKYANFILLFNADAWDFIKVQSRAYTQMQGADTASSKLPFSYNYILMAWGGFILLAGFILLTVYLMLRRLQPPYLMVHYARIERVLLFMVQIVSIPLGTVVFRLFQCTESNTMTVLNTVSCYEGLYWAYFVPALVVVIVLFAVVPAWMVRRIRGQRLRAATQHHEDYLQLKEVEYMAGLDVIWAVQGFHFFSSFRLPAIYYRPIVQLAKLILLIIYAAASPYIYNQAIAASVFLSLFAIAVAMVQPFRVTSFNVALGLSLGCLAGDAIFGAVIASVTPATVESPWLVEPYSYWVLIGINTVLANTLVTWLVYLVVRRSCCGKCCPNDNLWPVMTSYAFEVQGMETYKFMAGVLRARAVLDACIRAPSVFAPVHHLARQIEIINAFCREAEKTKDGFHPTLLQLLDDMIDVFHRLEPVSLFAETVQESIRQNAASFVELMPAFTHRLAQRDFDLILVHPVKKRMLMKMSIIGMFMNGRRQKPVRNPLTQNALHKLWDELPDEVIPREEVEYREDLYPPPVTGPDTDTLFMTGPVQNPLSLMELDDSDEEESLAAFLGRIPPVLVMKEDEPRPSSKSSSQFVLTDLEVRPGGKETIPWGSSGQADAKSFITGDGTEIIPRTTEGDTDILPGTVPSMTEDIPNTAEGSTEIIPGTADHSDDKTDFMESDDSQKSGEPTELRPKETQGITEAEISEMGFVNAAYTPEDDEVETEATTEMGSSPTEESAGSQEDGQVGEINEGQRESEEGHGPASSPIPGSE